MRASQPAVLAFFCLFLPASLAAQQSVSAATPASPAPPQPDAQASAAEGAALVQRGVAALTGGAPITDVTMTGTVTVGPTKESGTITLIATSSGQSQSTTATSKGTRIAVQDISGSAPSLTASGTDGISHKVRTAAALTPHPAWFYPALVLASAVSSNYTASYVGRETRNGIAVEHIAIWRTTGSAGAVSETFQRASRHDIFLDSATLLPVAMTFVLYAYDPKDPNRPIITHGGSTTDRLAEIQFSDYRQVQGRPVAFHIRSRMTISPYDATSELVSDLELSSVSFNTGAIIAAN